MTSRKIIGICLLLVLLAFYSAGAMMLAVNFLPDSRWAELAYYPLAGILWIFPAMKIIRWMQPAEQDE